MSPTKETIGIGDDWTIALFGEPRGDQVVPITDPPHSPGQLEVLEHGEVECVDRGHVAEDGRGKEECIPDDDMISKVLLTRDGASVRETGDGGT